MCVKTLRTQDISAPSDWCRSVRTVRRQCRKVFESVHCAINWPMSAHASQAFSIAHCTDSEDLPQCRSVWYRTVSDIQQTSVVTDYEFASKSVNFFPVRPSPNPRIFGSRKWRFWNVCLKIFSLHFSNLYHQNPVRMALTSFLLTHRYTTTTT